MDNRNKNSRTSNHADRPQSGEYRLKRIQRVVEYLLLISMHLSFLLAFREYCQVWMAGFIMLIVFGMNFQLTQLRESRRTEDPRSIRRIKADTLESVLFLLLVTGLSLGRFLTRSYMPVTREYLAYMAAVFCGLFAGALAGEAYWQLRRYSGLEAGARGNYVVNLKRTVILPYLADRKK